MGSTETLASIRKRYYKAYETGGATAVYALAIENKIKEWKYCKGCEEDTPRYKGECLVCGQ